WSRASARLEAHAGVAEADLVAVDQRVLGDPYAVDLGAVGRAQVDQQEPVAVGADLGVAAADVGVGEHDVRLGAAPDRDDVLLEGEPVIGGQDQAAGPGAAGALAEAAL